LRWLQLRGRNIQLDIVLGQFMWIQGKVRHCLTPSAS